MTVPFIIEGIPGALKALDELDGKDRTNTMRRAVRAGLQPMRRQLQFEGDTPGHPHSFTKVPPPKVSTRGGASGREIEGYVRPSSPLFNIFEPGAGQHEIAPKHGMLAGPAGEGSWTAKGRKRSGPFFARGPVRHPGMKARPILAAAFNSAVGAAEDAVANAIFGGSSGPVVGQ